MARAAGKTEEKGCPRLPSGAQREFIARDLRSRDEARRTGKYVKSDAVIGRLEKMLGRAKASAKGRR